jgi:hypothetical protein
MENTPTPTLGIGGKRVYHGAPSIENGPVFDTIKGMFRFFALSVCSVVCFAQTPADLFNRPPAEVDQALRARITEFYQDHVDGKFRQAESLVAEDTKDFFYSGNKPKYLNFEINRIDYSEGYTRAKAIVLCEQFVLMPGFTDKPLKVPTPSTWKLVDGQWYWYVDPDQLSLTPFGKMKAGSGTASGKPVIPKPEDMNFIFTLVKADKAAVSLAPGETERVTISNAAQGRMSISLSGAPEGVEVKLDRMDLSSGEKAVLSLRAGPDAKPGVISVRVEQTNQVIPISISIK